MALTAKQWKQKMSKVKNWDGAKQEADQQGGSVPDGRYKAQISKIELAESQSSGRDQINCFCEIVEEGDYQGQSIGAFMGLDEEKSLPWTIAALRRLGCKVDEPEDLVDAVDQLAEDLPEIMIRVKNGFANLEGLFEKKGEDDIGEEVESEEVEEVASEEDETVEEESEEATVEIGTKVLFTWKGEELEGEVKEIDEAAGKLKIKSGGKVYPVKAEDASIVAEEVEEVVEEEEEVVEDEPEEEPEVEEVAKKPAPKKGKPVAKKVTKPAAKKVTRKK